MDAQAALAIPVREGGGELRAVVGIAFGGEREFGESELSGEFSADLSQARPLVRADLTSRRLRMADFVPLRAGAAENGGAETGETPDPESKTALRY